MDYKAIYTSSFNGHLRKLLTQNRKIIQIVRAAITEAGMTGEIKSIQRTKNGEDRIPNVEKYDLPDGFRLVVQLVDGVAKTRAFLFVGSHDDTQQWLDSHKNYRWVKNRTDGTLEFVVVTESIEERHIPADRMDLESPEEMLQLPLLRVLSEDEWRQVNLPSEARDFAAAITAEDFERDADGILGKLDELSDYDKASLLLDLLWHAQSREWSELHRRISLSNGESIITKPEETATAMLSTDNTESFVTFEDIDLDHFFANNTLADWMLFLHPEQKKVSDREFKGPARLRGISGSGKTCVLIHRARHLAKKYQAPILLVTLTESMRKLLDRLADDLCGAERSLIITKTMSALARDTVHELHPRKSAFYTPAQQDRQQDPFIGNSLSHVRQHPDIRQTPFQSINDNSLRTFLQDEISYIRGRLLPKDFELYCEAHSFQRRGRVVPLNQISRRVVLSGINHYTQQLTSAHLLDHEGIVACAIDLLEQKPEIKGQFRCILSDEVQDLSELEVALIGKLRTPAGEQIARAENGLFLAGDGAQSIYKRGFVLRRLGIDIVGRSFSLRKNYRNTYEILKAAFGLVSQYEFADVDEENLAKPSTPEFAKRHGRPPLLLRCQNIAQEAKSVAKNIHSLLAMGHTAGQICIIGPNPKIREEAQLALEKEGIQFSELRQDVDYESDRVKVSTIESAKGHEFGAVFIMGLVEGILPNISIGPEEIPREAARLYVAMTRARENLTITYSPSTNYPASRFLMAIQTNCDEANLREGEIRRVSK